MNKWIKICCIDWVIESLITIIVAATVFHKILSPSSLFSNFVHNNKVNFVLNYRLQSKLHFNQIEIGNSGLNEKDEKKAWRAKRMSLRKLPFHWIIKQVLHHVESFSHSPESFAWFLPAHGSNFPVFVFDIKENSLSYAFQFRVWASSIRTEKQFRWKRLTVKSKTVLNDFWKLRCNCEWNKYLFFHNDSKIIQVLFRLRPYSSHFLFNESEKCTKLYKSLMGY